MKHQFHLQFRLPARYNSIVEIIERRRNLRQLLDALEVRETELLEQRQAIKLTPALLHAAVVLHDSRCSRFHGYPPDRRYARCGLQASPLWQEILSVKDPAANLRYDELWPWIILAAMEPARL